MKPGVKKLLTSILILPLSLLLGFGARILSLHILGALFKAWNLTEVTLPYAPVWAQRLTGLSGNIADVCFLIFFTLPLILYAEKAHVRFQKKHFIFPLSGILLSVLTVGAFLLTGSARMPKSRTFPVFSLSLLYAFTDFLSVTACAFLARKVPAKMFEKSVSARLMLSVLFTAAFWTLSKNSFSPVLILNACLAGILLFRLFEREKHVLPEILLLFTFRLFTRFVFGFPDAGGAYPVSEPLLTGAMKGVSHSVLLSLYLLILLLYHFLRAKNAWKGDRHVSP